MDNDLPFDFDLSNFLEINSESSESGDEKRFEETISFKKPPKHITTEKICKVNEVQIKNKLSYRATSQVLKLMNEMPDTTINLPNSKKGVQSLTHKKLDYKFLVICDKCDELNEDETECNCGQIVKVDSKKNNFSVHFDLAPQIYQILWKNFDVIIKYLNREHEEGVMCDIDDAKLYKKIREKNKHVHILPITMNLDGAQIFKSSNKSLWPVQLYLNFLPPSIRFLPNNIIVSTVYFGAKKPNMVNLLYSLATEFDAFNDKPMSVYKKDEFHNFLPIMIQCVCDLPARAEVQCFKGPTGKYGCSYCIHPGNPIKNLSGRTTIRYIKQNSSPPRRSHEETLVVSQLVVGKDSINGIKGQSPLLMFDHIDIINSVPTDYMHNGLLGIMKDLLEIWLGKKRIPQPPYVEYKIKTVAARKMLEQRILNLKPNIKFNRKPRSIFEIGNFKASELQNLLFFYLRYTLVGILPTRVVKNFEKLSAGMYILCKEKIKRHEISFASKMLVEFADEFEDIYGCGAVTMNIHVLRHYNEIIDNCGPLWCYGMFGFENNIGRLKNFVCGTTDVLSQIAHKYVISRDYDEMDSVREKSNDGFYQQSTISIEQEHSVALNSGGVFLNGTMEQFLNGKYGEEQESTEKSLHRFTQKKPSLLIILLNAPTIAWEKLYISLNIIQFRNCFSTFTKKIIKISTGVK